MPSLDLQQFGGLAPKIAERKLPDGAAQTSNNVRLESGDLAPLKTHSTVTQPDLRANTRTIFKYGAEWFSFSQNVSAINSPVAQDQYDRVYYTGDGTPKVTSNLIATGAGPDPQLGYDLGVPAPDAPVFVSVDGVDPDPDDFSDDETRFYVMTYVTEYGEEGPPSTVSSVITVVTPSIQTVTLTLPVLSPNNANVTKKRLYRTATTGQDTEFFFVREYNLAQTTVVDDVLPANLGALLETDDFLPPPSNMQGLVLGNNGIAAGFAGNELLFSEPFLPYAWPSAYRRSLEFPIVGIATAGTSFVVVTEGKPYFFNGISPDAMSETQMELSQACVSGRSLVDMGNYVIYASPDGLVGVREQGAELLTEKIFDKKSWATYAPETIHAYKYEDFYVAFYGDTNNDGNGTGGFMYDPQTGHFVTFDTYATAGFNDLVEDELYFVQSQVLKTWETAVGNYSYTYKSKVYRISDTSFSCAKIHTDQPNNVNFKVWANGELITDLQPITTEVIRLAPRRATDWEFEVSGTGDVSRVTLATSMGDL